MREKLSIRGAHPPAFAVSAGARGHGGIPLRYDTVPTFSIKIEYLKISINIDKFTGFFDK